jgi:magnesium transporter
MESLNQVLKDKEANKLKEIVSSLSGFEIASLISQKNTKDQVFVFSVLTPQLSAETFDYLPFRVQKKLLRILPSTQIANMLKEMAPDDRTALLHELPRKIVNKYLKLLPEQEAIMSLMLLGYPKDTVGHLMTTDYITIKMNWSLERVLDTIREYGHDSETLNMLYVIDHNNVLLDDIELKQFLFYPKEYKVAQLADNKFIALSPFDKIEQAVLVFETHGRVALPVIDNKGIIIGIVTIDDILSYSSERATKNLQKVGGTSALDEPYMETPFLHLMRKRAQWLVLIFLGELLTASVLGYFEQEIADAVVLALFLPLIISSGGNAGSQSTTLIIRAMTVGEVKITDWFRIMKREIFSGLFLGALLGLIGFTRISIWTLFSTIYGEHWILLGITISLSLVGVVMWGSLTGSMLPLALKRLKLDPATASAPLVASIVDVTGIIIYFGIALFLLKGTILP